LASPDIVELLCSIKEKDKDSCINQIAFHLKVLANKTKQGVSGNTEVSQICHRLVNGYLGQTA